MRSVTYIGALSALLVCGCHLASGLEDFSIDESDAGGHGGNGGNGGGGDGGGAAPSTCGDGQRDADEECDDGNADETDGCSTTCTVVCPAMSWRKGSNNHCYWLGTDGVAWPAAVAGCAALGDSIYLASLTTGQELALAEMMVPDSTSAWIGASDLTTEGQWIWQNGEPWAWDLYTTPPWLDASEPTNTNGNEHCLEVLGNGLFNDSICEWMRPPLCEFEPSGL